MTDSQFRPLPRLARFGLQSLNQTVRGAAPEKPGETEISFEFVSALEGRWVFARGRVSLAWD